MPMKQHLKVKVTEILLVTITLYLKLVCCTGQYTHHKVDFLAGQFSGPTTDDLVFLDVSHVGCIKRCAKRPGCIAVSYIPSSKICVHNFKVSLRPRVGGIFSELSNWPPELYSLPHSLCEENNLYRETSDGYICKRTECAWPTSEPTNGKYLGNVRRFGNKIAFLCNHGYAITESISTRSSSCKNGKWKKLANKCEEVQHTPLPNEPSTILTPVASPDTITTTSEPTPLAILPETTPMAIPEPIDNPALPSITTIAPVEPIENPTLPLSTPIAPVNPIENPALPSITTIAPVEPIENTALSSTTTIARVEPIENRALPSTTTIAPVEPIKNPALKETTPIAPVQPIENPQLYSTTPIAPPPESTNNPIHSETTTKAQSEQTSNLFVRSWPDN